MDSPKQTRITDYFDTVNRGYNHKTGDWHCIQCGDNMGPNNPRQLCGKTRCVNN